MPELADRDFRDIAEEMARYVHESLLTEGGKGLKSAVMHAMSHAIEWRRERDAKEAKQKK